MCVPLMCFPFKFINWFDPPAPNRPLSISSWLNHQSSSVLRYVNPMVSRYVIFYTYVKFCFSLRVLLPVLFRYGELWSCLPGPRSFLLHSRCGFASRKCLASSHLFPSRQDLNPLYAWISAACSITLFSFCFCLFLFSRHISIFCLHFVFFQ